MNAISLAQARAKNQHQEPSWIDDPFDLKGSVTGVTKISNHNPITYDTFPLEQFIDPACVEFYNREINNSNYQFQQDMGEINFVGSNC